MLKAAPTNIDKSKRIWFHERLPGVSATHIAAYITKYKGQLLFYTEYSEVCTKNSLTHILNCIYHKAGIPSGHHTAGGRVD